MFSESGTVEEQSVRIDAWQWWNSVPSPGQFRPASREDVTVPRQEKRKHVLTPGRRASLRAAPVDYRIVAIRDVDTQDAPPAGRSCLRWSRR